MARLSGKAGEVKAAASVTGIKQWSLDQHVDALDGTGFDSSGVRAFIPGCSDWKGRFSGPKNGAPLTIGAEIAMELLESQTATQKFTGQGILTDLSVEVSHDGLVMYSYSFQGTGALVIATA